ncbi:hypothetical protein BH708_01715 [Brachybacterium sp. P6-10-X1]|uniref:DUF3093 domain-containing protein n=1 Tax=Brachybacterium sp. P6-10-X1 TaxID=1903186 RepID=UPI000971B6F3|nr:DUF3093 domain-containing protein [Brachybacterium sp. P6-10-X1]APX31643.1 hypothetical protein BH708_01715 [Brachybacterium sp. P6-10-X1]
MSVTPDPGPTSSSRKQPASTSDPTGQQPLFRERLLPSPGAWIVVVALGSIVGLVMIPINLTLAIVVAIVCVVIAIVLAVLYSPVLEVAGGRFRLGRAQIEVSLLGEPEVLTGEDWQRTIGQDFEPLAHHCVRGWAHSGIRVEVLDAADPTSAWVATTRRPDDLALALRTARHGR